VIWHRRDIWQDTDPAADPSGGSQSLIELRDVSRTYELGSARFPALADVDLTIERGEFVAIVGKSGSGKSTLMNMIAGIDRPSSGGVFVAGADVAALSQDQVAVWRGRTIGVVFQFFQLLPTLTVAENVMLPMDFCRTIPARDRDGRAMELLSRVGIADLASKLPTTLSGGEQQRAAIARALANDPPILVADEPTGNLDSATTESIFGLFNELTSQGKTLVMVTHERDVDGRVDRTVTLSDGRIVAT
jgi:putative ABC transport system ATP-binding protein